MASSAAVAALHRQGAQALLRHSCAGFCRNSLNCRTAFGRSPVLLLICTFVAPSSPVPPQSVKASSIKRLGSSSFKGSTPQRLRFLTGCQKGFQTRLAGVSGGGLGVRMASSKATDGGKREIMVQHLLVKEDDEKLLTELQQRILMNGEDLGDLAAEYSQCPSAKEGGMLGWIKRGTLVPEFEEAAFAAKLNRPVKVKTKFGWHLIQVLSEREANEVTLMQVEDLHARLKEGLSEGTQLMDVREPHEVERASLPGFKVYPLSRFGEWAPSLDLDPKKETIVLCHHGMRSMQAATWLVQQGFKDVKNVVGGIDQYSKSADPNVPLY